MKNTAKSPSDAGYANESFPITSSTTELARRSQLRHEEQLRIADLQIDTLRHRAVRAHVPLSLTPKEFLLLKLLVHSAGEVIPRKRILDEVWDIRFDPGTNVVDAMVRRLRAKVDEPFKTKLIHTIRRVGYVCEAHDGDFRLANQNAMDQAFSHTLRHKEGIEHCFR